MRALRRLLLAAAMTAAVLLPATGAAAEPCQTVGHAGLPNCAPPSTAGDPGDPSDPTDPTVLGQQITRDSSGNLAFTGGDIAGMAALAGGALAVGLGLTVASRRRARV